MKPTLITYSVLTYICCIFVFTSRAQQLHYLRSYEVEDLNVEPDYRSLKLKWRYQQGPDPAGFTVRVCELSGWRLKQPCKQRHLSLDGSKQSSNIHDVLKNPSRGRYEAVLYQLRMLTNYSLTVEPSSTLRPLLSSNTEFGRAKVIKPKFAQVTTKGFSARASRCLGNTTDIEVHTGPYFSGKISVEDVPDERCAVFGDQKSSQSIYTLTIVHSVCGSKTVNNSRIETPVLVHENRELVTHNSRRFLVVCNFVPDTFTIKASVQVPHIKGSHDYADPIGHSIIEADPNEIFDESDQQRFKQNNVRDSRILAEQAAVVDKISVKKDSNNDSHFVVALCLTTTFALVFIGAIFWLVKTSRSMLSSKNNNNIKSQSDANDRRISGTQETSVSASDDKEMLVEDCSLDVSITYPTNEEQQSEQSTLNQV